MTARAFLWKRVRGLLAILGAACAWLAPAVVAQVTTSSGPLFAIGLSLFALGCIATTVLLVSYGFANLEITEVHETHVVEGRGAAIRLEVTYER